MMYTYEKWLQLLKSSLKRIWIDDYVASRPWSLYLVEYVQRFTVIIERYGYCTIVL